MKDPNLLKDRQIQRNAEWMKEMGSTLLASRMRSLYNQTDGRDCDKVGAYVATVVALMFALDKPDDRPTQSAVFDEALQILALFNNNEVIDHYQGRISNYCHPDEEAAIADNDMFP